MKQGEILHLGQFIGTEGKHLILSEKDETADLWQFKWSESHMDVPWPCVLWTGTQVHQNAWRLGAGAWGLESNSGQGLLVIVERHLRGWEGRNPWWKYLWRKARWPWRQGTTSESCVGRGASTVDSLTPHAGASSWAERPKQGWPFECLLHWAIEKDQLGRPFKHQLPDARKNS